MEVRQELNADHWRGHDGSDDVAPLQASGIPGTRPRLQQTTHVATNSSFGEQSFDPLHRPSPGGGRLIVTYIVPENLLHTAVTKVLGALPIIILYVRISFPLKQERHHFQMALHGSYMQCCVSVTVLQVFVLLHAVQK